MDGIPLGIASSPSAVIAFLILLLAGMVYGLYKALLNGTLRTGREVQEKDARIDAQARMIEELTDQNRMLLGETIPTITSVLVALREAPGKKAT